MQIIGITSARGSKRVFSRVESHPRAPVHNFFSIVQFVFYFPKCHLRAGAFNFSPNRIVFLTHIRLVYCKALHTGCLLSLNTFNKRIIRFEMSACINYNKNATYFKLILKTFKIKIQKDVF